jgi:hypothetical protein
MGLTNPETILTDLNGNFYGVSGTMALPSGAIGQMVAGVDANGIVQYLTTVSGSLLVTGSFASSVIFPSELYIANFPAVQAVSGSQLTGSTFGGFPVVQGGVYYGSGNVGSLPAYVRAIQTDVSGAVYVTTSGSLAVTVSAPVSVSGTINITSNYVSGSTPVSPTSDLVAGWDQNNVVRIIRTDPQGRLINQCTGSTCTSVAASVSNATLLQTNPNRVGAIIFNEGPSICYVKFGPAATTSNYTVQISAKGYYEVPFTYIGRIDAVFSTNTGNARITELF